MKYWYPIWLTLSAVLYIICRNIALQERGYLAYGGECLIPVVLPLVAYVIKTHLTEKAMVNGAVSVSGKNFKRD